MESSHDMHQSVHKVSESVQIRLSLICILAVCLLLPALAAAQPQTHDIKAELERTDRILERAKEKVRISITSNAGDLLARAISLQKQAWRDVRTPSEASLRNALSLTIRARDLAARAVEAAEIEIKAHETTRDLIESVRDLIDQAVTEVRESSDEQAGQLLQAGINQLQKAREAYLAHEYRKAISLATTARDLIQRAMTQARSVSPGRSREVEGELDRTNSLLDEVKAALDRSPSSKAERLYDDAKRLQRQAVMRHREGRDRLALQLTSQARQAAKDALVLTSQDPDREDVQRAISAVGRLISSLSSAIAESDSEDAKRLLNSARQRHAEASEQLERGNYKRALEIARLADGLLRRAAEAVGKR